MDAIALSNPLTTPSMLLVTWEKYYTLGPYHAICCMVNFLGAFFPSVYYSLVHTACMKWFKGIHPSWSIQYSFMNADSLVCVITSYQCHKPSCIFSSDQHPPSSMKKDNNLRYYTLSQDHHWVQSTFPIY